MLPTTSLAFALASMQAVAALPSAEAPDAVADIRLAINGVVQDTKNVIGRATTGYTLAAYLWNDQCSGTADFKWYTEAYGECFTFVDQNGKNLDMYSIKFDAKHCYTFGYHSNYECKGNTWSSGMAKDNECNSFDKQESIKSFSVNCPN